MTPKSKRTAPSKIKENASSKKDQKKQKSKTHHKSNSSSEDIYEESSVASSSSLSSFVSSVPSHISTVSSPSTSSINCESEDSDYEIEEASKKSKIKKPKRNPQQKKTQKRKSVDKIKINSSSPMKSTCLSSPVGAVIRRLINKNGSDQKLVGAHVSTANGGLYMAVQRSMQIGGESLALFLKCQRRWDTKPIDSTAINNFKDSCQKFSFLPSNHVLPHGSYLINLGNPDAEKRKRSFDSFLDDLKRCELLSIGLYNFHPGSTVGECSVNESIKNISNCINDAHKLTSKVTIVLENMAGQGNVIGSTFEQLRDIITAVHDKSRIGVCLDTCHLFSAGYDIRTKESFDKVLKEFDSIIGLSYLRGCHLNDSKGPLGCNRDRHENIGKGYIGLECFRFIMNDDRFNGIPLILETPADPDTEESTYEKEIELLYSLVDDKARKG